jgi:predicted cupin superfamily sugar epimerase
LKERVKELARDLGLRPHDEGGLFAEVFRSDVNVRSTDGRGERSAVTTIYFLLAAGERGRWHQVLSDELWHYYEGDRLELLWIDPQTRQSGITILGPEVGGAHSVGVIRSGWWQAARTTGEYTLVGCTVAPGFEYGDYRVFGPGSEEAEEIRRQFPNDEELL